MREELLMSSSYLPLRVPNELFLQAIRPLAVIPLSGRVPGRASGPSRARIDDGGSLQYVSRKIDWAFRFFPVEGNI
jgi:hypothetical protein